VRRVAGSRPLLPLDDPWSGYATTIVAVIRPGSDNLFVAAAPAGDVGVWPWSAETVVYVLTAWDPGERRLGQSVNRARQTQLEEELRTARCHMWNARGFDPDTGYREEGVAVSGLPEADVLAAGARFGQEAVFAWTPDEWAIVACAGRRRVAFGWQVTLGDPGL